MLLLKIAFRNLLRQLRRSILTSLTMVVGFFLLSLSIGLSRGSYETIIQLFTKEKTGHVQIHFTDYLSRPTLYKTLKPSLLPKLEKFSFVQSYAPRIYSSALAFHREKAVGIKMMGIDYRREFQTTNLKKKLTAGKFSKRGVVITYKLAQVLKLKIGDELVLISQGADGSISNDIFSISGIAGGKDDYNIERICYLDLKNAQDFLALGDRFHEIAIITPSYQRASSFANMLTAVLKDRDLDIQPWQVVESSFYEAMQADIKGMWISIGIIMLIVAMGVLNTVLMSLLERTREFGIMKALGTTPLFLFSLIIIEVVLLAGFSITVGSIFAFGGNWYFAKYGITLPTPIKFGGMEFSVYESTLSFDVFWMPAVLILLTSFAISLFPAIRMARKRPLQAIEHI